MKENAKTMKNKKAPRNRKINFFYVCFLSVCVFNFHKKNFLQTCKHSQSDELFDSKERDECNTTRHRLMYNGPETFDGVGKKLFKMALK